MPIYSFAASIIFVVFVARRKHIRALSPYGIFIVFQILYNVMPWITASSGVDSALFGLMSDMRLVNIQLVLAAISNVCFGLVFLMFYRDVRFAAPPLPSSKRVRRNYLYLAFPLFLVTCALCEKYGWHQLSFAGYAVGGGETLGGMFTVTAYVKYVFVAVYLFYLYRFGLDKGAWILLGQHVIVMVIDGARTTFLPVFLVTLFMLLDKGSNRKKLKTIYTLGLAGFVLSIGTRALVLRDSNLLQNMVTPVVVEGTMGDYSCLQSIQGVENLPHPQYTFGATYILDPLVWLIPRSMGREGLSSFTQWTNGLAPVLNERFSPMGGFYYLSEAIAAYSYAGPPIVTTIFAFVLVWVDRNKNTHRMLYLAWMPTVGLVFIKVIFGNGVKLFLIELLSLQILRMLGQFKMLLPRRVSKSNIIGPVQESESPGFPGI